MKSNRLQEREVSRTCQEVACTRFCRDSHALVRCSHLQVLAADKTYLEVSYVPCRCDHLDWVEDRTWLGASCIGCYCEVLLEYDHLWEEDMICLEASCTPYCWGFL